MSNLWALFCLLTGDGVTGNAAGSGGLSPVVWFALLPDRSIMVSYLQRIRQQRRAVMAAVCTATLLTTAAAPTAGAGIFDSFSAGSSQSGTYAPSTPSDAGASIPVRIPTYDQPLGAAPEFLAERDKLGHYENFTDWRWLQSAPQLGPGVGIINTSTETRACSAGWLLHATGSTGQELLYALTAGHCGLGPAGNNDHPTTPNIYALERGAGVLTRRIGVQETQRYTNSVVDYALIQLSDDFLSATNQEGQPVDNVLPTVPTRGPVLHGLTQIDRPLNPDMLVAGETWLCHLGRASGLACGKFVGFNRAGMVLFNADAAPGDSGGPVFAVDNNHIYPVGILSTGQRDATGVRQLQVQTLTGVLKDWKNLRFSQ
ncbi:trypsin-like serine protease [Corynebacterium choanae]|uniref:Trypsin n=1 Tax=Corynebacterium choanae TaxID=1862358 RepID=A0A3G6JAY6_9CORY|nr:trypsin-like serine protease [Corynebacterium choanae]AZA13144.1 Trypsin [Corynebacterium choanae]